MAKTVINKQDGPHSMEKIFSQPLLEKAIHQRYHTLSKRLQQVARYLLDHQDTISFETISSIAEKSHVPPSTLIRFANAFGFSGFNELKQLYRQHLMENTGSYTERVRLFRETADNPAALSQKPSDILTAFSHANEQALQQLPLSIDHQHLQQAINLLQNAENIYIVGLRRAFSIANYLTYALRHLEQRAFLMDSLGGMFKEQTTLLREKDVVIAISYSPYSQEVVDFSQQCAEKGISQIIITDSSVSPLINNGEVNFIIREAQIEGFRSQITSMCLAQTLVVGLALQQANEQALTRL